MPTLTPDVRPEITEDDLRAVRDRASLFDFLGRSLGWETGSEDTFTYLTPPQPGLPPDRIEVSRIVPFGAVPFVLMLAEFQAPLRRADLRKILAGIRRSRGIGAEEIIFVCPTPDETGAEDYGGVSFAHFEEREGRAPRLEVFGWDAAHLRETRTLRTVNLRALGMPGRDRADEYDWETGRARWLKAWDVEAVTAEFFKAYKLAFAGAEAAITGVQGDTRLFTQRLFNRLLFVQFLSKKGQTGGRRPWLRFGGRTDYLLALWEGRDPALNFYNSRLRPLFASALNNPHCRSLERDNPTLYALLGDVPFLNGGLFQPADDEGKSEVVPDEAVAAVMDLFRHYNFTISESTPDDVEVAVDPEMLGKVFEELVTGRHESGSYYTPRPVVAFMCREALKGYLGGGEAVARFVDDNDSSLLPDPEGTLAALKAVQVCDPACGSGAYLLGMMQELLRLRETLFTARVRDFKKLYDRKLEIIERNLYGVDKDPFAANIAMLRLWLSLVVDDERDPLDPALPSEARAVSLPNLKFKVQVGDSLAAPAPDTLQFSLYGAEYVQDAQHLAALHGEYFAPGHQGRTRPKAAIEADIDARQAEVAHLIGAEAPKGVVDWRVAFAEVFAPQGAAAPAQPGGFDIVLANPPYVKGGSITEQKPRLKQIYPQVYDGDADLYCYFYARAIQMLRPGGMLAFITPNKWFRTGYGTPLKKHIAQTCRIVGITDFGELPVFQAAATFPMIFVAEKGGGHGSPIFTQVKSLSAPYPDVLALVRRDGHQLPLDAINGADWTLTDLASADRLRKIEKAGIPLGEYVSRRIYRGIVTGSNAVFYISGATRTRLIQQDSTSQQIIKPLVVGDDVRRWRLRHDDQWVIFVRRGVNLEDYPAVKDYLIPLKSRLLPRPKEWDKERDGKWPGRKPGRYKWYELQDETAYFQSFEAPKIVYPDIGMESRFSLDINNYYLDNTATCIASSDLYLLGLLNSDTVWGYVKEKCAVLGDAEAGGRVRLKSFYVEKIPVPDAPGADRAAIAALVQKCLDAKGVGCEAWEAEINGRVAALYGL